jgi:hypothetical protein
VDRLRPDTRVGTKDLQVRRLKGSIDSVHTLDRDEVSALRKLKATSTSPFVFVSGRGGPLSPDMIARIVERAAETARLGFHVHPNMLRHATGYALANEGTDMRLIQDFLGHASISNTVRYTKLAPDAWQRYGCGEDLPPIAAHPAIIGTTALWRDIVVATRDVRVIRLMAEIEEERQLRLKAEQRASGLKSANQRLQSTVLKLKAQVMDSASPTMDRE